MTGKTPYGSEWEKAHKELMKSQVEDEMTIIERDFDSKPAIQRFFISLYHRIIYVLIMIYGKTRSLFNKEYREYFSEIVEMTNEINERMERKKQQGDAKQ